MEQISNSIPEYNPDDIKFENTGDFNIMIISPNNIESLDFNHPGYVTKLINQDFISIKSTNPKEFVKELSESLKIDDFDGEDRNIVTQVFYDKPEFIYEMMFLDVRTKELKTSQNENQFASMLNIEGEKIYGYVIILSTNIPNNKDKSMFFSDMTKNELYEILDSRANTKVVIYQDGEFREEVVRGDMDVFCKHLFEEDYFKKIEMNFLQHNLNIWYLNDEYGTELSEKLVPGKVECAVFFTMICKEYRGNITLDEVKKMVELSKVLEDFGLKKEWVEEEKDDLNRKIIKNKYKVLEYAYKKYIKKD